MSLPKIEQQPFFPIDDIDENTEIALWQTLKHTSYETLHYNTTSSPLHRIGHTSIITALRRSIFDATQEEGEYAFSRGFGTYEVIASLIENPTALDELGVVRQGIQIYQRTLNVRSLETLAEASDYALDHNPRLMKLMGRVAQRNHISKKSYFAAGAGTALQLNLNARVPKI